MGARPSAGGIDRLLAELLIQMLMYLDIPSLTGFWRANRRAMDLVYSVPQYVSIIKHCLDIIRAILSMQATAFDCRTLFATLSTT